MGLSAGTRLGTYEVKSSLGVGGMGEVYLAKDTRLGREVAIKVLPESFARDSERLARFEREARLLAALNHPNIGAIYGLQEHESTSYLVLELVPGQTLAQRLKRGPLPVAEALAICRQVAEALEAAHEKGIVHRDLKSANVIITPEGKAKVLDFGLAKGLEVEGSAADLSRTPTVTGEATGVGVVLGTAAYMSPEQARGLPLDTRTDIWSFGCVLYEALTGRKAFEGATVSDTVAAILDREPDWQALPQKTPERARWLLRRCLEKDLRNRLRHIGDARIELEDASAPPGTGPLSAVAVAGVSRRTFIATAAGGLLAGAAGTEVFERYSPRGAASAAQIVRFALPLAPGQRLVPHFVPMLAISPDAKYVAFSDAQGQLYLRALDHLETKPIQGVRGGAPFFSPDGRWVGYRDPITRTVKKVALSGGAPITMFASNLIYGAAWGHDGYIYVTVSYPGAVTRIPATGGTPEDITKLDTQKEERIHRMVELLPGGGALLFTVGGGGMDSYDEARIVAYSLKSGQRKTLIEGGTCARYSPSGHVVYARAGGLFVVPFDLKRLEVTGPPVQVMDGVLMSRNTGAAHISLSAAGDLVYAPGGVEGGERTLMWVDRQGKAQPLGLPPRSYLHPRISPDGRQLAVEIEGPSHDVYLYEFSRGVLTKLTLDGSSHWPLWTPDGKRITFRRWLNNTFSMWWMPADRSASEERLTTIGEMQSPVSWSPDARFLSFTGMGTEKVPAVYVLPMDQDRKPQPVAQSKFPAGSAKFSPDGRWLAYCSNESGRSEVYVQVYPGPGPKIQVSNDGGSDPLWKRKGGELYYRNADKMMVVSVTTSPTFSASKPRLLWEGQYSHGMSSSCGAPGPTSSNYDVTPDGQRFLMIRDKAQDFYATQLNVILNWAEELKHLNPDQRA